MRNRWIAALCVGAFLSFAATQNAFAAGEITLANCIPDGGAGGDNTTRAFYFRNFPGQNLGTVTVGIESNVGGSTFTLTARHGTFDGTIIGAPVATNVRATVGESEVPFDFGGAPTTPGETITFALTLTTDASAVSLDTGMAPCPVEETNGTTPPLDTDRRDSIGVIVTTRAPTLTSVAPNSGITAGGSSVSLNGANFLAPASVAFGDAGVTGSITVGADGGTLLLDTPPNPTGSVDITITTLYQNDGGVDASAVTTLAAGYTYGDIVIPADSGSISTSDGGGSGADGGAVTTRDDAGTDNADNGDSSGCSCRAAGDDSSASMVGAILVGVVALFGLRRSKKR
jgi:MYXO-CTERM domain-containing protein